MTTHHTQPTTPKRWRLTGAYWLVALGAAWTVVWCYGATAILGSVTSQSDYLISNPVPISIHITDTSISGASIGSKVAAFGVLVSGWVILSFFTKRRK